ncbi:MAG: class I SAM-dependent methyltransferase [Gaiellaceae bacterium]
MQPREAPPPRLAYDEAYHRSVHAYLHDPRIYERFSRLNRQRYFPRIGPQDAVFEYGCGLGQNLYGLPAGTKVGYEISEYAREFCAAKGISTVAEFDDVPLGGFDAVISRHNLEHLEHPAENLRRLRALLEPQGWLYLIVPEEPTRRVQDYEPDVNNHLYAWTPRTLANLLHHTGFATREIRREANSGLMFFSALADRSYCLFDRAVRAADRVRWRPGEWVAEARPRDASA